MGLIKPRVSSYIGRGNALVAEGKTPEAMKLIEEGLNYYSKRIVNAINPYAKMDAGMIVLVLRHLQKETELKNGAVVLPAAGANVIGISLVETDEAVSTGDDVDIQIKDIGKWVAGEEIAVGDELATDASGHAVVATSGAFIVGVALSSAAEAGTWVQVQISKSGYKA